MQVIGTSDVCAWKTVPGVIWVQTRDWQIARDLARRKRARLVVRGVAGGFLRTYEFAGRDLAWARSLVSKLLYAYCHLSEADDTTARDDSETGSRQRQTPSTFPAGV
jgi:hypothetical protein